MKIAFGSDHGGFKLKGDLLSFAQKQGYEVLDFGTFSEQRVDYPDYARIVGCSVTSGETDFGVLICRSGEGMTIAANKIRGIRAALGWNRAVAELSRRHNNANVLCFGADFVTPEDAEEIFLAWLSTPFEGGRHQRRVEKMEI